MRALGLIGLLLALLISALVLRKQLEPATPASAAAPANTAQAKQVTDEVKRALDEAMRQRRALPDE